MSYMSAGSVMGRGSRSAVVFPGTTPATEGAFEPQVLALDPPPAIYLKLADTADSSGHGRNATLGGTGGAFVSAITPNVGAGNGAFDTQGTAFLSVAHNAVDVALTSPAANALRDAYLANTSASVETLLAPYRFIAAAIVGCDFNPQALPTGSNRAVIFAKSHTVSPTSGLSTAYAETHPINAGRGDTVNGGSFEAYFDANGAVHVEMRSFRGRRVTIRTPDGAVTTGQRYRLEVRLDYDGITAFLNGAQFEDGYGNLLHVYGLAADIRGAIFRNNYAWTIGKAAWGGQADIIVDEFTVFNRRPSTTLSQSDINTLAQVGSTPAPLAHHIWGAQSVNASSFASLQAAVDNITASGGGTVLASGTFSGTDIGPSSILTLKNGVRIKTTSTLAINGRVITATPTLANIGPGSGDYATGDRTIAVTNSRAVGDLIHVQCDRMPTASDISPRRHDRRWNTTTESNDKAVNDSQSFEIESRTGSAITMVGVGLLYDFPIANRTNAVNIIAATPTRDIALEGAITITAASTPLQPQYTRNMRCVGTIVRCTGTGTGNRVVEPEFFCMNMQFRDCDFRHTAGVNENVGVFTPNWSTIDIVTKNLTATGPSHFADTGTNFNFGTNNRHEHHVLNGLSYSANGNRAKFGTHGPTSDCIYWGIKTVFGGNGMCGWKNDVNFCILGTSTAADHIPNDGMGDCCIRNCHSAGTVVGWFSTEEGTCGCDRCHFENITRANTPSGGVHQLNYGTGADVNTYRNVDAALRHASWTAV